MADNDPVAKTMQSVANGLKSQGVAGSPESTDVKCNSATNEGKGPDLSGYGAGKNPLPSDD